MANRNWASGGKIYSMHVKPVLLDCNFIVDSTNANGLGISSLKGPCIRNVFMNTAATPGSNNGYLNPNPAAGYIMVQLSDNYNRAFFDALAAISSPGSGTPLTSVTAGLAYSIVSVGTTTLAQWQARGLPVGFTPAVGISFIATSTGALGGTGSVQVPATAGSNITNIEAVGDINVSIAGFTSAGPTGAYLILRCLKNAVIQAPANGSLISLSFYLSDSAIQISGE